jgi:hypothetical protein
MTTPPVDKIIIHYEVSIGTDLKMSTAKNWEGGGQLRGQNF